MSKPKPCGVELPVSLSVAAYSGKPIYHRVLPKTEYLRQTEEWQRQYRRAQILWRLGSLAVLAVFAFLVLD
jgi:hypothetical protein